MEGIVLVERGLGRHPAAAPLRVAGALVLPVVVVLVLVLVLLHVVLVLHVHLLLVSGKHLRVHAALPEARVVVRHPSSVSYKNNSLRRRRGRDDADEEAGCGPIRSGVLIQYIQT